MGGAKKKKSPYRSCSGLYCCWCYWHGHLRRIQPTAFYTDRKTIMETTNSASTSRAYHGTSSSKSPVTHSAARRVRMASATLTVASGLSNTWPMNLDSA
ncbi:hypothetical protein MTO96_026046 [Rhipicephalus appendiculatus]